MKAIKILKSKKGTVIENAVIFMVIIFSLCALLTSLTLIGNYQTKIDNMILLRKVELDQLGEDYLASLSANTDFAEAYENYAYEVSGNTLTVWRKSDENKTAVLYIEAEKLADGQISVKQWRYSPPGE